MRTLLTGVVLAVTAACALGACNGDDDAAAPTDGASDTTTETPATDDNGDTAETTSPPDTAGLTPSLRNVLDRQKDAVIKVTYERGDDTFTIAQDGRSRSITTSNAKSIVTPERAVDCSSLDTEPVCLEVPEGVSSLVNIGLLFYDQVAQGLATAAETYPPIETTQDEVAGRPAICAEGDAATFLSGLTAALGTVPEQTVRACVDSETGYLLSYATESDPADDLVATEVTEPTDADFEAPVEVQGF